jgi:ribonuclease HI
MTAQHPPGAQQTTFSDPAFEHPLPAVTVYTDGGCDPNPGPGGWAAVIRLPDREIVLQGNDPQSTNNRMELEAAIAALAYLQGRYGGCSIDLHTDSTYMQRGIGDWIERWVANGWQTQSKQPVKNQDLWRALYGLIQIHRVRWHWVRGHAGDPQNERVDRLAGQARARLSALDQDASANQDNGAQVQPEAAPECPAAEITISIGVACQGGTGPGAWVAILRLGENTKTLTGRERETSSARLHLQAAVAALGALQRPVEVVVYTVDEYLAKGASEWVVKWQQRGWLTSGRKPVRHRALWQALLRAAQPHAVTWQAVRADAAPDDLVQARRLAKEAAIGEWTS